jgi:site-specific DNA recombinase
MRVAQYVRVSTHGQEADGYSIEEQTDRLNGYCQSRGWKSITIYKDASSGSNLDRQGIQSLVRDIKRYDVVLVYKLDRLSRSQKDTLHLIEDVMIPNNVGFLSVSESIDTTTPVGKAMIGLLSVFAQLEREQIKERMSMGKLGRVKSGKTSAWAVPPFGYRYEEGQLVIDELRAGVVRGMYREYLAGCSITRLVDLLNGSGHVGKSRAWSYRTVRAVLDNRTYTGVTTYRGQAYPGDHEAIVSAGDWDQTQTELQRRQVEAYAKNNNPRPFQAKYLLSGLLRCRCGAAMELIQGNRRKDGTRRKQYKCRTQTSKKHGRSMYRNPAGCDSRVYEVDELESLILDQIEGLRLDPSALDETPRHDESARAAVIQAGLDETAARLERVTLLYIEGKLPKALLDEQRERLETSRVALQAELDSLACETPDLPPDAARELLAGLLGDIRAMDQAERHRVTRALIGRVELDGEDMRVYWRFA